MVAIVSCIEDLEGEDKGVTRSGRDWFAHENAVHYRACHLPRGFWLLRHRVEESPGHIYIHSG